MSGAVATNKREVFQTWPFESTKLWVRTRQRPLVMLGRASSHHCSCIPFK